MTYVRWLRVLSVVSLTTTLVVAVSTAPAAAHGVDGVDASNYETRILSIEPAIEGLSVRSVDLGEQLELRSTLDVDVTVLGYYGEPYLRVGPTGTFENARSPSLEINSDPEAIDDVGDELPDRAEAPEWVRTGTGDTLRWHDHRAHWMSDTPPPFVQDAPDAFHTVSEFEIALLVGDDQSTVGGEVVWVPPPSVWPAVLAALVLGVGVVAMSRTRWWRTTFIGVLGVLAASEMIHVVGAWGATTATVASELASGMYSMAAVLVLVGALAWMVRASDPYDPTPLVAIAGLVTFIAGGLAEATTLNHSQIVTNLPPVLARSIVVLALGLGGGLLVGAGLRLRRPQRRRTRA